jgi:outer membrane protein assembly factor BamD
VVEQYPKSEYAHDSLQRMVYLRDRLASYEVHVAQYYYKRGAYVAAAQRARGAIEQYDGSPAVEQALDLLIQCYDHMQLEALATQSRDVYAANYSQNGRTLAADAKKSWWRFW